MFCATSKRATLSLALSSLALLMAANPAYALIVNENAFKAAGGDPANIAGTLAAANEPLHRNSYLPQYLSVGRIYTCTATWIGEDDRYAYVLTAAHCLPNQGTLAAKIDRNFYGWDGSVIAGGVGWSFIHPYRLNKPPGFGGASTDIGLMRLPRRSPLVDVAGMAVAPPALYDGKDEVGKPVSLVGYGLWGVAGTSNAAWTPALDQRRLWGETMIDELFEMDHGIQAGYDLIDGPRWARSASGDSGSAWWQQHDGQWTVIATTNGNGGNRSHGARVSRYIGWVKELFPGVSLASDRFQVTATRPLVSHNYALDAVSGTVYYVVPRQDNASGPTEGIWSGNADSSLVEVAAQHSVTGKTSTVFLRGQRDNGCSRLRMHDAVICSGKRQGPLTLSYHPEDNEGIPGGRYTAAFEVEARGWHVPFSKRLPVTLDLTIGTAGTVTQTQAYTSPNFAEHASKGTVYYTVPGPQAAQGPIEGVWSGGAGHSQVVVQAQDVIAQQPVKVFLRGQRFNGCRQLRMEDAVICQNQQQGPLTLTFAREDNPHLGPSLYTGNVQVQARGWHDEAVDEWLDIDVRIDLLDASR